MAEGINALEFLTDVFKNGERILILKQSGTISEIRGELNLSTSEKFITLTTSHCACHIHLSWSDMCAALFVSQEKDGGTFSHAIELLDKDNGVILKIYFSTRGSEIPENEFQRLKALYDKGQPVLLLRNPS